MTKKSERARDGADRIDVAREFAVCVRKMGAVVLDDSLAPNKPKNADYWFAAYNIIGELKQLQEDRLAKPGAQERLTRLHTSWVARGLLPPSPRTRIRLNLKTIPEVCAIEFLKPLKRHLEGKVLAQANRQIKASKVELDAPTAKGVLFLVNDGDTTFVPEMVAYALVRSLSTNSSINHVIYLSVNEFVTIPGMPMPAPFWIEMPLPERERVERAFLEDVRSAWLAHYSTIVPSASVAEVKMRSDPKVIQGIQFRKR